MNGLDDGLIIDNFAGGGGASIGIAMAMGRPADIAVNHDPEAVAMHAANHPDTLHLCQDVWAVDPVEVCAGRPVTLAWFSPDCTHFSRAKGGKPVSHNRRCLADVVIRWARAVQPRVVFLENVAEFQDWGPLDEDGRPLPEGRGLEFRRWLSELRGCGYDVELRELVACDYGAPTSRKRLFVVARCDGRPIVWPRPTHGRGRSAYRTAAECIEWVIPCPSIFDRKRPLAENTLKRIARGIKRYVLECPEPFIVKNMTHNVPRGVSEPLSTILTGGHHLLVNPVVAGPFIAGVGGRQGQSPERSADRPYQTITTKADSVLVSPMLMHYRDRDGREPRFQRPDAPIGTITAGGIQQALVSAFIAEHGASAQLSLEARPMHRDEVRAFLMAYYGTDQDTQLRLPLPTVTTHDRFGIVLVEGQEYEIADIGMRMLRPRELFRAQGFPDSYRIDVECNGKPLSQASQVRMCGNSVVPLLADALVRANLVAQSEVAA